MEELVKFQFGKPFVQGAILRYSAPLEAFPERLHYHLSYFDKMMLREVRQRPFEFALYECELGFGIAPRDFRDHG
ncbi:MAG: hypothetical protein QW346_03190 [Candidatus Micrarchaeaceae archaeon]